jgi:hypothetical protein
MVEVTCAWAMFAFCKVHVEDLRTPVSPEPFIQSFATRRTSKLLHL